HVKALRQLQAPSWSLETLAARRSQSLPYVCPSQPQTGRYSRVHICDIRAQVPSMSGALQRPTRWSQNSPSPQVTPTMVPQIAPSLPLLGGVSLPFGVSPLPLA